MTGDANVHRTERVEVDGFDAVRLSSPAAGLAATFVPAAGMVCCSLSHEGDELLGQRHGLRAYAERGSTMGIPLLYPWANRLAGFNYTAGGRVVALDPGSPLLHLDPNGLPIHGLLGGAPWWELVRDQADAGGAALAARLAFDRPELLAGFPFEHELTVEATLRGARLTISTTIAAAASAVPISFGFHPYLAPPGAAREDWEIEAPVRERLVLDERQIPTGGRVDDPIAPGPLRSRTFDDGFAGVMPQTTFAVAAAGRRISVRFDDGYPFAQVYAPPDDAVLCFEPMTAPANALVTAGPELRMVAPGDAWSATFSVAVEPAGEG